MDNANSGASFMGGLKALVDLLMGRDSQQPSAQEYDPEATPQPTPQATPMPSPTPGAQGTPTPYDTGTPLHQALFGNPQPSPTPGPQAMGHPAMKLQLAKAGMPNPVEEEGQPRRQMIRRG